MSGDMSIDDTSSYIHDCLFPLFLDFAVVKNIAINTPVCSIICLEYLSRNEMIGS